MANERDKDLPLIVAEILIELHEVRTDIKEMRTDIKEMRVDIRRLTKSMDDHTDGIRALTTTLIELVQTNHRVLSGRLDDHENRINRFEDGQ